MKIKIITKGPNIKRITSDEDLDDGIYIDADGDYVVHQCMSFAIFDGETGELVSTSEPSWPITFAPAGTKIEIVA
jgi:ribosomal protein L21E